MNRQTNQQIILLGLKPGHICMLMQLCLMFLTGLVINITYALMNRAINIILCAVDHIRLNKTWPKEYILKFKTPSITILSFKSNTATSF